MASPFQNPNHDSEFISNFSLTLEDFKIFHSIDRQLYTRLVISLGHDPIESMHVMALLLWLERSTYNLYLVNRLLKLPDTILYHVVEEIASVLKVVENDDFPYIHEDVNSSKIPLLQTLMSKHDDDDDVTLRFFHSHRLGLVRGVTHLMNEICVKVFNDIMQKVVKNCQQSLFHFSPMMENVASRPPGNFNTNRTRMSLSGIGSNYNGATISYDPRTSYIKATATQPPYDLHDVQRDTMNAQMEELLHEVYVTCIEGDNGRGATSEVPPDDRTIFLTFSKGYPISKSEVRDFFTRRNGDDAIDSIYMQEVSSSHEQILYARMVVKSQGLVDVILGGKDVKAKFTINGKHVWGRKYVKKAGAVAGTYPL